MRIKKGKAKNVHALSKNEREREREKEEQGLIASLL